MRKLLAAFLVMWLPAASVLGAAEDAKPVPAKNEASRITFSIYDGDGDPVTGAAGLDSECSCDAGTIADCTNEATEIATSSGFYYLDLTSSEMNCNTVAVKVKSTTGGSKDVMLVIYPNEATDIDVNVQAISDDTTAATNAESFFDGSGYAGTGNTIPTVTTLTGHTAQTGDSYSRIGANGAGLTGIPYNSAWDADIESEVNDAAIALHLDHLLATDYDPASKPGTATALLNELVESDAGVSRFTANALEQGPGGGTGLASLSTGTAQAGAAGTITLASGEPSADQTYQHARVVTTGGTGAGQSRLITDYDGTTKVATVDRSWVTNPDATTTYEVQATEASVASYTNLLGYEMRSLWWDGTNGTSGAVVGVNGTRDNPSGTEADLLTLIGATDIVQVRLIDVFDGLALSAGTWDFTHFICGSDNWVSLSSRSCDYCVFDGCNVYGTNGADALRVRGGTTGNLAPGTDTWIEDAGIQLITLDTGTTTVVRGWNVDGNASQFDFGAAVANTDLHIRDFNGDLDIRNMGQSGTDTADITGSGTLLVNANSTGGTINLYGVWRVTNNGSSTVNTYGLTGVGSTITEAQVNAQCDQALLDYDGPTNTEMEARTLVAANYATAANQTTIIGDTNELQTDWADGGRLDNILDGRASQTTADAIETDTQDVQSRLPATLVGGRIDSSVGAMAASGLSDFFDTDSGTTYSSAVAGSVVKETADNAADTSASDLWSTSLPASYTAGQAGYIVGNEIRGRSLLITPGSIKVGSPLLDTDSIELVKGDDYSTGDNTMLDWDDITNAPDLTGATASFTLIRNGTVVLTQAGVIVTATGSSKRITVDLTAAQTSGLTAVTHEFRLTVTLASGGTKTLIIGRASVIE